MNMTKKRIFWESVISIIIVIAIIEIFLEDISALNTWSNSARATLLIIGFILDLIFTIEFIIRSILSRKEKGFGHYFSREMGWIDFLSSIPLLLFNSGPIMLGMFFQGKLLALPFLGLLNILKVAKIIRIARMLRLLRMMKLFKHVKVTAGTDRLVQLSRIVSIGVFTIIVVLTVSTFFPKVFYNMDNLIDKKNERYINALQEWYYSIRKRNFSRINFIKTYLKEDKDVLFLYFMGTPVINNIGEGEKPEKVIPEKYFYTDYRVINYLNFKMWYSIIDIIKINAGINLLIETIIVALVISYLVFYKI